VVHTLFAVAPGRLGAVLAGELAGLGVQPARVAASGVELEGELALAYRVCLWSRIASRVLLRLGELAIAAVDDLYDGARAIPWSDHLRPGGTLAVDCVVGARLPPGLRSASFAALRVKDAIVDSLRERGWPRPAVDRTRPELRVNLLLDGPRAELRLDLSGASLHRRGYRPDRGGAGRAPLKENLAAALLLHAGWPERAARGEPFMDPMCGAGTLPIEAALVATDTAPGLLPGAHDLALERWPGHDRAAWESLRAEAGERASAGRARLARRPCAIGYDADASAVRAALGCLERAGLRGLVHVERRALSDAAPVGDGAGLIVTNPPYGERLGDPEGLVPLYVELGDCLKRRFAGWDAHLLVASAELARYVGLRAARRLPVWNADIECRLLHFPIVGGRARDGAALPARSARLPPTGEGAAAFANRVRKNLRRLARWAAREGVSCYRIYDADIPEYAVAVDRYEEHAVVQEHAPPPTVDAAAARRRLRQVVSLLPGLLGVAPEHVHLRVRRRQRGGAQYERRGSGGELVPVREGGHRFLVNFTDYLDTGLFLAGRATRALVGELARGRSFLNLFAYTCAATVYAARGGARATTSVDLSASYLERGRRNLELNGVRGPRHRLERADCLTWLEAARGRYELIFLEPPTFSSSKAMRSSFDVQRDHAALIAGAARLLAPGGVLLFSASARRFALDAAALAGLGLAVEDWSRRTLAPDFARRAREHRLYRIAARDS
jgi:23S rRNA (guanine2445-N2)-methyltransferase / 23S rRNA (guanine2069-N7)-methyltransferase